MARECDAAADYESSPGEIQLWHAVILIAIEDAQRTAKPGARNFDDIAREADDAREWLLRPNKDFVQVCHLAGLDPDAVREQVRRVLTRR